LQNSPQNSGNCKGTTSGIAATVLEQWRRVFPRAAAGEDQQAGRSGSSPSPLLCLSGGAPPSHL